MATTNDFGFDYVFNLAQNLSPEERERLIQQLAEAEKQENMQARIQSDPAAPEEEYDEEDLAYFARIKKIQEKMKAKLPTPKKTKEEMLRLLLDFPVLSEEEIQAMEEAREALNTCRLASLLTRTS